MARSFLPLLIGLVLGVLGTTAFTYCVPQKWEYKSEYVTERDMDTKGGILELSKDGAEGWEVAGVLPCSNPGNGYAGAVILKRKK